MRSGVSALRPQDPRSRKGFINIGGSGSAPDRVLLTRANSIVLQGHPISSRLNPDPLSSPVPLEFVGIRGKVLISEHGRLFHPCPGILHGQLALSSPAAQGTRARLRGPGCSFLYRGFS